MKVESPAFTPDDIKSFVTDYFERERTFLIERLNGISRAVSEIPDEIAEKGGSEDSWSPAETLAHMATASQYFGWLIHQVATQNDVGDVLSMLQMRDMASSEAVKLPVDELVGQLKTTLERTISFIETVPYEDLRKSFDYVGITMTAEDLIRIPLCSHLESHIDQMRSAIG